MVERTSDYRPVVTPDSPNNSAPVETKKSSYAGRLFSKLQAIGGKVQNIPQNVSRQLTEVGKKFLQSRGELKIRGSCKLPEQAIPTALKAAAIAARVKNELKVKVDPDLKNISAPKLGIIEKTDNPQIFRFNPTPKPIANPAVIPGLNEINDLENIPAPQSVIPKKADNPQRPRSKPAPVPSKPPVPIGDSILAAAAGGNSPVIGQQVKRFGEIKSLTQKELVEFLKAVSVEVATTPGKKALEEAFKKFGAGILDHNFLMSRINEIKDPELKSTAIRYFVQYQATLIGHEFGIGGKIKFNERNFVIGQEAVNMIQKVKGDGWKIDKSETVAALEGHCQISAHNKLAQSLKDFFNDSPLGKQVDPELQKSIIHSLEPTAHIRDITPSDEELNEILKDIQSGKTVTIPTGWYGHATTITISGNTLAYANRGQASDGWISGIRICKIGNPEKIDMAFLKQVILMGGEEAVKDKMKFLESKVEEEGMHKLLGLSEIHFIYKKDQKVGNCTWASAKCAFQAQLFMNEIKKVAPRNDQDFETFKEILTRHLDTPTLSARIQQNAKDLEELKKNEMALKNDPQGNFQRLVREIEDLRKELTSCVNNLENLANAEVDKSEELRAKQKSLKEEIALKEIAKSEETKKIEAPRKKIEEDDLLADIKQEFLSKTENQALFKALENYFKLGNLNQPKNEIKKLIDDLKELQLPRINNNIAQHNSNQIYKSWNIELRKSELAAFIDLLLTNNEDNELIPKSEEMKVMGEFFNKFYTPGKKEKYNEISNLAGQAMEGMVLEMFEKRNYSINDGIISLKDVENPNAVAKSILKGKLPGAFIMTADKDGAIKIHYIKGKVLGEISMTLKDDGKYYIGDSDKGMSSMKEATEHIKSLCGTDSCMPILNQHIIDRAISGKKGLD